MNVVISQPMFLPWIGVFEQIRLADLYIHYDDVQMPMGRSFMSRVQIKSYDGVRWLTAPVHRQGGSTLIKDVKFVEGNWRGKHVRALSKCFGQCPFGEDALDIVHKIYALPTEFLCDFNIHAIELISEYFRLETRFQRSSKFPTDAKSTEHLLHLVECFSGDHYITGHGARNYLNHELFEERKIQVRYMNYKRLPYPQKYGYFDPHVSILDVIANCGQSGRDLICSDTLDWREFINERDRKF